MPEEVKQVEWQHIDKLTYYTLGSAFFIGINAVLYPTDVIKTRLQVQRTNVLYNGTFDALFKTLKSEGLKGLYKGFLVSQLSVLACIFTLQAMKFRVQKCLSLATVLAGL